ncbi:hypothetical protein LXL04_008293 [Taraxacum kok-saghyz]
MTAVSDIFSVGEEVEVNGFDGDKDLCFYVATIIRLYRLTADVRFRDLKSRNGESLEGAIRMEVLRPKPPVFVYEYKSGDAVEGWMDNKWCKGRFSSFSCWPKNWRIKDGVEYRSYDKSHRCIRKEEIEYRSYDKSHQCIRKEEVKKDDLLDHKSLESPLHPKGKPSDALNPRTC